MLRARDEANQGTRDVSSLDRCDAACAEDPLLARACASDEGSARWRSDVLCPAVVTAVCPFPALSDRSDGKVTAHAPGPINRKYCHPSRTPPPAQSKLWDAQFPDRMAGGRRYPISAAADSGGIHVGRRGTAELIPLGARGQCS